jgi:hypothetical protein
MIPATPLRGTVKSYVRCHDVGAVPTVHDKLMLTLCLIPQFYFIFYNRDKTIVEKATKSKETQATGKIVGIGKA